MPTEPKPRFFATPEAFRRWLAANAAKRTELWVGFYKVGSGKPSITWPQSVDEALCFGWIDGIRRSLGAEAYAIRFTPRKPGSTWSRVNVARVEALEREGRMTAAGRAAFAARKAARTGTYTYEQAGEAALPAAMARRFRAHAKAWAHFQSRPPWYRRTALRWVTSAKRAETRERRFATLVACCARGEPIPPLAYGKK